MIDRIEYHVEHAREYIETAKQDTKKAREFQRKSRRVSIALILFFTIIICLLTNWCFITVFLETNINNSLFSNSTFGTDRYSWRCVRSLTSIIS